MEDNITRRQALALLGGTLLLSSGAKAAPTRLGAGGEEETVALSDLDLTLVDQTWNSVGKNLSVIGTPLSIAGVSFTQGVGTHAESHVNIHLDRRTRRFRASVGVDDSAAAGGTVRFSVLGDGQELWNSGIRRKGDPALALDLDVSRVQWLTLRVDDAGDGIAGDHADWADAVFVGVGKPPVLVARLPGEDNALLPGRRWCDTSGSPIQAHGGGLLRHGGQWWWYGEDRSDGYIAVGVAAYVSSDLLHWKRVGLVLPRAAYNQTHGDQTICERPKVVYNPATGKFVLWFHYDRTGYRDSRAGVAVAARPEGPFQFLGVHRPVETSTFRDMNVFVDDDHRAYVFYAGEGNSTMHVVRLNADWTGPEQPMVQGKTWERILVGKQREAPAPFKHAGKYYLITSACTGWAPNAADLSAADGPLGPWQSLGNPCVGPDADTTYGTQSTFVLPTPGNPHGDFLFLADLWKPKNLTDSRYVWLPLRLQANSAVLPWLPQWVPGPNTTKPG